MSKRGLALCLVGWTIVSASAQLRFDAEAQYRLAEGMVAKASHGIQGRFVTLADSYIIIDPVLTLGLEGRDRAYRYGLGLRGVFPHPLAGSTRLWPLGWAELDLWYFGLRADLGFGPLTLPADGLTRWDPWWVPGLTAFAAVPALTLGSVLEVQPRLGLTVRGFAPAWGPWEVNPFSVALSLGVAARL